MQIQHWPACSNVDLRFTQVLCYVSANHNYKRKYKNTNVLVPQAAPSVLQVNDVILALDSIDIAGDETVQFRDDERLDYSHVVRLKHIGEQLKVDLLRNGEVGGAACCLHCKPFFE